MSNSSQEQTLALLQMGEQDMSVRVAIGRIDTQFGRAMDLLADHGYRAQSVTTMRSGGSLHIFTGPKGAVIVQTYPDPKDGVTMYADWPLGATWEQTEIALSRPMLCS